MGASRVSINFDYNCKYCYSDGFIESRSSLGFRGIIGFQM